jgi:cell division protein FtsL
MSIFYIEILLFAILSIGSVILISMNSRLKRVENDTMYINSYTRRNKLSIDTLETQVLANNALINKPKAKRGRPRKSKAIVHELGN